jgi:hypothetical protein
VKEKPTVMDEIKALESASPPIQEEKGIPIVSVVDAKETLKVVDEKIVINSPRYSPAPIAPVAIDTAPLAKKGFFRKLFNKK